MNPDHASATFAAGCFWQVEQAFREVEGVLRTEVGYIGGQTAQPTYEQVCTGRTGHAEAVRVEYNPRRVSYHTLLNVFFRVHDPTQVDRQGPDVGSQYRSAIFYHDPAQRQEAEKALAEREQSGGDRLRLATLLVPADRFWPAEDYHQQYLARRGRTACATTVEG